MNKFWIIVSHTYFSKFKAKGFIITVLATLLLVWAGTNFNKIIDFFDKDKKETIAILDKTKQFASPLEMHWKQQGDKDIILVPFNGTEKEAETKVHDETWDGYVILSQDEKGFPKGTYKSLTVAESKIPTKIQTALQQLKLTIVTQKIGLTEQQLTEMYAPISFEKIALEQGAKTEQQLDQARIIVMIIEYLIYFSVISYGSMIATEVASEKSSRVMEILISSVSPIQQMFGKIIGIALLSVTHLVILFVAFRLFAQGSSADYLELILTVPTSLLVYGLAFFILGYFLYATLFAMVGSLVSRLEDVQQLVLPISLIIIVAFFIASFGLGNPNSMFLTVSSFIPFFSPMIMFLRIGMLDVPTWQILLSFGILIGSIVFFAYIGAKVYRGGVLMYGKAPSWKDIGKALQLMKK